MQQNFLCKKKENFQQTFTLAKVNFFINIYDFSAIYELFDVLYFGCSRANLRRQCSLLFFGGFRHTYTNTHTHNTRTQARSHTYAHASRRALYTGLYEVVTATSAYQPVVPSSCRRASLHPPAKNLSPARAFGGRPLVAQNISAPSPERIQSLQNTL